MSKTITLTAAFKTDRDEQAMEDLGNYCRHMGIDMGAIQINDYMRLSFTAPQHQLTELEEHLTGFFNDQH